MGEIYQTGAKTPLSGGPKTPPGGGSPGAPPAPPRGGRKSAHFGGYLITLPVGTDEHSGTGRVRTPPWDGTAPGRGPQPPASRVRLRHLRGGPGDRPYDTAERGRQRVITPVTGHRLGAPGKRSSEAAGRASRSAVRYHASPFATWAKQRMSIRAWPDDAQRRQQHLSCPESVDAVGRGALGCEWGATDAPLQSSCLP